MRQQLKQDRKLKVLCLHGHNTDSKVLAHQMRHFRQVFNEVMDFHMLDAPFDCQDAPKAALKHFLPRKSKACFKSWLKFHGWLPEEEKK
jgi:hypothetical protein